MARYNQVLCTMRRETFSNLLKIDKDSMVKLIRDCDRLEKLDDTILMYWSDVLWNSSFLEVKWFMNCVDGGLDNDSFLLVISNHDYYEVSTYGNYVLGNPFCPNIKVDLESDSGEEFNIKAFI